MRIDYAVDDKAKLLLRVVPDEVERCDDDRLDLYELIQDLYERGVVLICLQPIRRRMDPAYSPPPSWPLPLWSS